MTLRSSSLIKFSLQYHRGLIATESGKRLPSLSGLSSRTLPRLLPAWFGDHRELRGGSLATHLRLHHPAYCNLFTPERTDVFAGFRTVGTPS